MRINIIEILLSLPAVFLAIAFHEFAHAYSAYRLGDPTPKNMGRLTLDPLAHVDWLGFIMFALFGFGWAKPVQVNPSNFRDRRLGNIIVSLAGPAANMLLSILTLLVLTLVQLFVDDLGILWNIVVRIIHLNILFAILNLIPIPPFDGYHILRELFYRKNVRFFWQYERYGLFVLLIFIFLGLFDIIVGVPANQIYNRLMQLQGYVLFLLQ
ncbi:MAG: site-2 protease family protein [Clostridiales bacterium]|mgnify:CR=1 FL=1|jgi:Zn-dependent protease|nr:site-2 protease family protein [Clostridiales bacterium]